MTFDDNSNAEVTREQSLNTTKYRLNEDSDNHLHSLNTKLQAGNLVTLLLINYGSHLIHP